MRLYGDIRTHGHYFTYVWIGTPPQKFSLFVDTGSHLTFVPCSTCQHCGNSKSLKFRPEFSSTYRPVLCYDMCQCDDELRFCTYEISYAGGDSSKGILGEDVISFGDQGDLLPQRVVFGCENSGSGIYLTDGMLGLSHDGENIINQLVAKAVINNTFSLCHGGMGIGGGSLLLGSVSLPSGTISIDYDPSDGRYEVDFTEIHIAGEPMHVDSTLFGRTMIDSGTTFFGLPEEALKAFKAFVIKKLPFLKLVPSDDFVCFDVGGSETSELSNIFPEVDLIFDKGKKLSLPPENYLFKHGTIPNAYCLAAFQSPSVLGRVTILGAILFRNVAVTYDRENLKIGFWKTNCSEISKKLKIPRSSPPPVGKIIFRMSVGVSYLYLEANIAALVESLSVELGVYPSQVHLLNYSSQGNASFIEWALGPSGSAPHISRTTAHKLVRSVVEHQIQLPYQFGSYELLSWKFEPLVDKMTMPLERVPQVPAYILFIVPSVPASLGIGWCLRRRQRRRRQRI